MFGDSVQSSPISTMGRSAGGSLSSLYQARKANDSATVEQIKQHFQKQIEAMLQSSQRHEGGANGKATAPNIQPPPQFRISPDRAAVNEDKFRHKISVPEPPPPTRGSRPLPSRPTMPPQNTDGKMQNKSFQEARTVVQKQIEKMFVGTTGDEGVQQKQGAGRVIKHSMHGVSHVTPQEEEQYNPPPPVHYGVNQALMSRQEPQPQSFPSSRASQPAQQQPSPGPEHGSTLERNPKFQSMTSLTSSVTLNNSIVDIGNIDMSQRREKKNLVDRSKRASMHESSPDAPVPMRDRKRVEKAAVNRRISIHQDKFDFSSQDTTRQELRGAALDSKAGYSSRASDSESQYEPVGSAPVRSPPQSDSSSKVKAPPQKFVKHRIEYLGAVPLGNKATNLQALQMPLKELYFKNKALQSLGHSNLPGTLEISDTGMKIQYIRELHKGVQEIFNSFPTIAVWAAVKFVHKSVILPSGERRQKFSFLPLISDPESTERTRAFYDLDYEEVSVGKCLSVKAILTDFFFQLNLAMDSPHPPVFACVMRRSGSPKQLECHGFICSSAEDAIIIAANLYQSLLDTMKKHKAAGPKKKIEEEKVLPRNELVRQSVRKSLRRPAADPPVRPPRRKRREAGREERLVPGLVRRKSVRSSTRSVRSNRSMRGSRFQGSRQQAPGARPADGFRQSGRYRSEFGRQSARKSTRGKSGQAMGNTKSNGDLFTKVSIGRTKSFVKTGNQYNLQELFRELKEKEGVESIDDVLKRVISPNGMSFNDIKPVYRELLLKLAMTMSQDEIFERSKTIMAHNKKSRKKQQAADQKADAQTGSLGSFFKSFSKSNAKSSTMASSKKSTISSVSVAHAPSRGRNTFDSGFISNSSMATSRSGKGKSLTKADISGPIPILPSSTKPSSTSISSKDQVDDAYGSCSECTYESCNYESCRIKSPQRRPNHKDVKGFKSPPESSESACEICDDTDSCISGEKCYCSLRGDPRSAPRSRHPPAPPSMYSDAVTDSGTATDTTCYSCNTHPSRPTDLSSCDSPQTAWRRNSRTSPTTSCSRTNCTCSDYSESGTTSTQLSPSARQHVVAHPIATLRRNNSGGSGYQSNDSYASPPQTWFNMKSNVRNEIHDGRGSSGASSCSSSSRRSISSPHSSSSPRSSSSPQLKPAIARQDSNGKMLLLSAVDRQGNVVYRGASNNKPIVTRAQDEENIMSLKKSAEIAALFSGARINQTTDLVDHLDPDSGAETTDHGEYRGSEADRRDYRGSEAHSRMSQKLGYFP